MNLPLPHRTFAVADLSASGAFLLCADCMIVHRVTEADHAPLFRDDASEEPRDDREVFLSRHARHDLRPLWRTSDVEVRSHARSDPMASVTWEVTDGQSSFVVTSAREHIDQPRRYTASRGRILTKSEGIELDVSLLEHVLADELTPGSTNAETLTILVEGCRELVMAQPSDAFEPIDEDRRHPNVLLACLPKAVTRQLQIRLRDFGPSPEIERLDKVLDHELRFNIPVVRIERHFAVIRGSG